MIKFYFSLWFSWLIRVISCTLFIAGCLATVITLFVYAKQGFILIDKDILQALIAVWKFWFAISLNLALLFALFRSIKYLFNRCHSGFTLKLKTCFKERSSEFIEIIGYGDLVKVWRKWFMTLIWLVGALMVVALVCTYIFTQYHSLFDWFNITMLYIFIAIGAYLSFILIVARCKKIGVVKC